MADWYSNGAPAETIATGDRGLQYGDGLFETVAMREGSPRLWDYHMQRLAKGCDRLGIDRPSEAELLDRIMQAMRDSNVSPSYGVAKIIVSAGTTQRGYGRAHVSNPTVLIGAFPSIPVAEKSYRAGIEVVICQTRLATHSATAGLKTLNRLEQVLARSEFAGKKIFEGLTADSEDRLICGTMSNVFFVVDRKIFTPSLDRCGVEGVMRRHLINCLRACGTQIVEKAVNLADIATVDEMFISNSQFGLLPISRCAKRSLPVGEVTRDAMRVLAENGVAECR